MTTAASTANPFRLLRSYLFWTYDRGSIHYDVMVSLILAFLFLGPRFIDFGDKPVATVPLRSTEVLVKEEGSTGTHSRFLYEIRADQQKGFPNPNQTEQQRRAAILRVIEPISGEVTLDHYEEIRDAKGKIIAYDAWILR
ncbi:MAG TPA: hypothetical protein VH250_07960 [Granulicella sp.]|jgi:hypothetical protein|nr:hypothetical protein [Granulicella sp.]